MADAINAVAALIAPCVANVAVIIAIIQMLVTRARHEIASIWVNKVK